MCGSFHWVMAKSVSLGRISRQSGAGAEVGGTESGAGVEFNVVNRQARINSKANVIKGRVSRVFVIDLVLLLSYPREVMK